MSTLFFWKSWKQPLQTLYIFLLVFYGLSLLAFITSVYIGTDAIIHWDVVPQLENTKIIVDQFSKSLLNYSVEADSFLLTERFSASDLAVNTIPAYIFLFFIIVALIYGLAITSHLTMFGYLIGMTAILLFLVNLRFELLEIFNLQDRTFVIGLIAAVGGLSYYFQAFKEDTSWLLRLLSFSAVVILAGIVIAIGQNTTNPVLYLVNYGQLGTMILTVVFIIIIGFEIINGFLFITTDSKTPNNKTRILNFGIISLLYLANLFLLLLKKMNYIDWDILYVNPFLIYFISAIIGIWGYRKRSVLFKEIIPFAPAGAFYYLLLAIISNATLGYAFITGNDPLIEAFEYLIIFSQLLFGVMFFLYVLVNFWMLFNKNVSIYAIVYQPRITPFFMVRGVGGAGVLALIFYMNYAPFYRAMAGYYNLLGDVYKYENNYPLAKEYYETAITYEFQNARSNYSLACVSNDKNAAIEYYTQALIRYQKEYTYVNLSNIYLSENLYFPALFTLKDGLKRFPESGYIANNLALLYSKTDITDSTIYFYELAKNNSPFKEVSSSNLLALMIKKDLIKEADSISLAQDFPDHIAYQNNKLIAQSKNNKISPAEIQKKFLPDSILNKSTFAYLYNYTLNQVKHDEKKSLELIAKYLKPDTNALYSEDLRLAESMKYYYTYDKAKGKTILENLKNNSSKTLYYKILGLWMLQQNAAPMAEEYFKEAKTDASQETLLKYCIAMLESGKIPDAAFYLKELQRSGHEGIGSISKNLYSISTTQSQDSILQWSDEMKFQYIHFRKSSSDILLIHLIHNSMKDVELKIWGTAELMVHYINKNGLSGAQEIWENIPEKNSGTYGEGLINYQYLRLVAAQTNWDKLKDILEKVKLNPDRAGDKSYFLALVAENKNKQAEAEMLYQKALKEAPFNEEGIIYAANFFNKNRNSIEGYNILLRSLDLYPNSILLLKAYALQSIKINLSNYGENALQKLSLLMTDKEYVEFKNQFLKEKELADKNLF